MPINNKLSGAEALFTPFRLKNLDLKNRFVMAPMTRQHSPGNVPNQENVDYYVRRADGEVGLILTEGTPVNRPGKIHYTDVPRFYGEDALAGWRKVVTAVHEHGGKIAPQLWHVGKVAIDPKGKQDNSVQLEGPATMSIDDIQKTIAAYGQAAADAKRLGFDALEIHGAHGYLIDQFFWGETNTRTDEYGGKTLKERTRFAVDVLKSIRRAVGPDFVVILRVSQWKLGNYDFQLAKNPQDMEEWLTPLAEAGADILHVSTRHFWKPEFAGSDLGAAGWAKKITGLPIIAVGSVGLNADFISSFGGANSSQADLSNLVRRYEQGEFDLVAVGRALLNDPNWVKKVREQNGGFTDFTAASLGRYY